jgi:hypothetical protein
MTPDEVRSMVREWMRQRHMSALALSKLVGASRTHTQGFISGYEKYPPQALLRHFGLVERTIYERVPAWQQKPDTTPVIHLTKPNWPHRT